MGGSYTYTDAELREAVGRSHSWRGVLRDLGLAGSSAAAIRSVRRHAEQLHLDVSHFTGGRGWRDGDLCTAIARARSWAEVIERLGLVHIPTATLRGHATRLGVDVSHLDAQPAASPHLHLRPDPQYLRRAGSMLAAAWFTACGCEVAWPLEPCRYDLLVKDGDRLRRVQVKTTTKRTGASWTAALSSKRHGPRATYTPEEIDDFFVVDASGDLYLIPLAAVGGLHAITLSAYAGFRVPPLTAGAGAPDGTTV